MSVAAVDGIPCYPLQEFVGKDSNQEEKKTLWEGGSVDMVRKKESSFQIRTIHIKRGGNGNFIVPTYFASVLISNPNNSFRHGCHAHCKDNEI